MRAHDGVIGEILASFLLPGLRLGCQFSASCSSSSGSSADVCLRSGQVAFITTSSRRQVGIQRWPTRTDQDRPLPGRMTATQADIEVAAIVNDRRTFGEFGRHILCIVSGLINTGPSGIVSSIENQGGGSTEAQHADAEMPDRLTDRRPIPRAKKRASQRRRMLEAPRTTARGRRCPDRRTVSVGAALAGEQPPANFCIPAGQPCFVNRGALLAWEAHLGLLSHGRSGGPWGSARHQRSRHRFHRPAGARMNRGAESPSGCCPRRGRH